MSWLNVVRDIVSPLLGIGIMVHEMFLIPEPRYIGVATAFVLMGLPLDALLRVLSFRTSSSDTQLPSVPPSLPSSAGD